MTPTTYARGSSTVSQGTLAARKTLSTASVRRCAFPFVPGPSPMNKPPGRRDAFLSSKSKSAKDSSSASVATTASARVMCTWFTRRGGSRDTASSPLRNAFSYASSKEASARRSVFLFSSAPAPIFSPLDVHGVRGSSNTPAATPSLNTARAAAARAPRMNVSPPPGSSATAAIAASAPPGESKASNTTPYVSRPGPELVCVSVSPGVSPTPFFRFMSMYSRSASLQSPARPSVAMSAWRVARLCGTFAARISSHVARAALTASASPAAAAAAHVPSTLPNVYTSGSSGVLSLTSASSARATATPPDAFKEALRALDDASSELYEL